MSKVSYKIEGMTCNGCVKSVTQALSAAFPEAKVHVRLEGGVVVVDGVHDMKALASAVEDAGFDFVGRQG